MQGSYKPGIRFLKRIGLFFEPDFPLNSPISVRRGVLFGLLLYDAYAILDLYLMPLNFKFAWIIRFAIVTPALVLVFILSYSEKFHKYHKIFLFVLLFFGALGILAMIYVSDPSEKAYFDYYSGLILVMFWGKFVFQLSFRTTLTISTFIVISYNLIATFKQNLPFYPVESTEFTTWLGNNFFMCSSALLALLGAFLLDKTQYNLIIANRHLETEKTALKDAKEKAEESDRLKSSFVANMSHEVRTPMNAIAGFSQMLITKDPPAEKRNFYARMIMDNCNRLLKIINDILDLSRFENHEIEIFKEQIDIDSLLDDIYESMLSQIKSPQVELIVVKPLQQERIQINTDKVRLQQIITNLLFNAIKFTNEGFIKIGYETMPDKVRFFITDTGIGIDPKNHELIFKRFRQVENDVARSYGGNGLGLAISKELVELLGGTIHVESELNEGATFWFELPKK